MGDFSIGKRVRFSNRDGTIAGKASGMKYVVFDDGCERFVRKSELTPIMINLQVGGMYVTRGGDVVGPLVRNEYKFTRHEYPWAVHDSSWRTWNSRGLYLGACEHRLDIVSVCTDGLPTHPPEAPDTRQEKCENEFPVAEFSAGDSVAVSGIVVKVLPNRLRVDIGIGTDVLVSKERVIKNH